MHVDPYNDPRCVLLNGDISDSDGAWTKPGIKPAEFAQRLKKCKAVKPLVVFGSRGGATAGGFEIGQMIASDPRTITGVCHRALSSASVPFAACDRRLMMAGGELQIHSPSMFAGFNDPDGIFLAYARQCILDELARYYPAIASDKLAEWLDESRVFSAKEAVEVGLAHEVISEARS